MIKAAEMVHHRLPIEQRPDLRLDITNLESLCNQCHAITHAQDHK